MHPTWFGDFLMGLRLPTSDRPGLWEFPGGKVEDGEDPRVALAREWAEEIGIVVDVKECVATGIVDADMRIMIQAYELTTDADLASLDLARNLSAHQEIRWAGIDYAVKRMPCSPGFYVHFSFIDLWLSDRIRRMK